MGDGVGIDRGEAHRELNVVLLVALGILLLRRIGPVGALLARVPVVGPALPFFVLSLGVVAWSWTRRGSLADLGLALPGSLAATAGWGVAATGARFLATWSVVGAATLLGAAPETGVTDPLRDDSSLLFTLLPAMWLVGALGEEILHRGFIMTRLAVMFGEDRAAWTRAWLLQALIFGIGHLGQGIVGATARGASAAAASSRSAPWSSRGSRGRSSSSSSVSTASSSAGSAR